MAGCRENGPRSEWPLKAELVLPLHGLHRVAADEPLPPAPKSIWSTPKLDTAVSEETAFRTPPLNPPDDPRLRPSVKLGVFGNYDPIRPAPTAFGNNAVTHFP